jgi:hypothetical protein
MNREDMEFFENLFRSLETEMRIGFEQQGKVSEQNGKVLFKLEEATTVLTYAQGLHAATLADHKAWLGELSLAQARTQEQMRKTEESIRQTQEQMREWLAEMEEQTRKTEESIRQTQKQMLESDARTEKRIADLVSGIGRFMSGSKG